MNKYEPILNNIAKILNGYVEEKRFTTKQARLNEIKEKFSSYEYDPDDAIIRETLLEHVGTTPIVATILYPHINDPEVDLGMALRMLAVHDIGELVVGDEIVFKKSHDKKTEQAAALNLLDPIYHGIYLEAESLGSKTAKFAKSVDKISADIEDYLTDADVTDMRFARFVDTPRNKIVGLIRKHKRPYMEWNEFMLGFHDYLMKQLGKKLGSAK
jgi:hypothetical protein